MKKIFIEPQTESLDLLVPAHILMDSNDPEDEPNLWGAPSRRAFEK